jgi:bifunctional DNA-binding transcriptional regulator/antitoxin component of YhaV-PrlF toxin-antitoxin module
MPTLTVTAKGQVTLKKDLLEHLGVRPGDQITVDKQPGGRLAVGAAKQKGDFSQLFGIIKPPPGTPPLSIEEMNEIIAKGWAGEL